MRVLVVGASGAIGSRLVPQLREGGHDVIASSRSSGKAERLRALRAEPIVLDALDARAVREAVAAVRADAIVYQATALSDLSDFKHFDRSFAQTNRLRTEGTDIILAAARKAECGASCSRATPITATRAWAGRSRPRTTRSTRPRRPPCARRSRR